VPRKEERRVKVMGTIPDDLEKWIQQRIKSRAFYSMSHALEVAVRRLKEDDEKRRRPPSEKGEPDG